MFERILKSVAKLLKYSFTFEDCSRRKGALQRIEPRFVFISLLLLVIITVLMHNLMSILIVIILAIMLAALSQLPLVWYLKRVWLFVPLFTVFIMIPSMTNLFTPGYQIGYVIHYFNTTVYFTKEGIIYAVTFTLRVGAAVSISLLIVATIEWSTLMNTLSRLNFPRSFVMILDMTYRYIHLLLNSVLTMFIARKSRMVGKTTSKELRNIGSSVVASLFSKSYQMSEQTYLAMVSRGFTGAPVVVLGRRANLSDYAFALSVILFALILVIFDLTRSQEVLVYVSGYVKELV